MIAKTYTVRVSAPSSTLQTIESAELSYAEAYLFASAGGDRERLRPHKSQMCAEASFADGTGRQWHVVSNAA